MTFVLAGSNEEIENTLVPRDETVVVQEEGVWPDAGLIRSDCGESWILLRKFCLQ